ncbi:MAG: hypothetical protein AAGC47_06215 [Bacteroidota bacterium]
MPTQFFKIICFLSLVRASYGIVGGIMGAIAPPDVDEQFIADFMARFDSLELPMEQFRDQVETYSLNTMLSIGNISAANFLFFGVQIIGVILMYRLNRIGFVLYIAAQIGLAFVPAVFGGFSVFGTATLGVTLFWNFIWVIIYWTQVRKFPAE